MTLKNRVGERYGRLVIIRQAESYISPGGSWQTVWECKCDCGKIKNVRKCALINGLTNSCGCLNAERRTTHGQSRTAIYERWLDMTRRCNNPSAHNYKHYGARGIKVCKRWKKFENFLRDMGLPPSSRHSIDRINNDGDYEPENCRWATQKQQTRNTRKNVFLVWNGERRCVAEWAEILKINPRTIYSRIRYGFPVARIFA